MGKRRGELIEAEVVLRCLSCPDFRKISFTCKRSNPARSCRYRAVRRFLQRTEVKGAKW